MPKEAIPVNFNPAEMREQAVVKLMAAIEEFNKTITRIDALYEFFGVPKGAAPPRTASPVADVDVPATTMRRPHRRKAYRKTLGERQQAMKDRAGMPYAGFTQIEAITDVLGKSAVPLDAHALAAKLVEGGYPFTSKVPHTSVYQEIRRQSKKFETIRPSTIERLQGRRTAFALKGQPAKKSQAAKPAKQWSNKNGDETLTAAVIRTIRESGPRTAEEIANVLAGEKHPVLRGKERPETNVRWALQTLKDKGRVARHNNADSITWSAV